MIKKKSIPCSLLFWYYCCFLVNVELWGGTIQWAGVLVRWVLVNQGFTLPMLGKIISCRKLFFKFISWKVLCVSKPCIILQTGKLTFPSASWGVEREREEQRCNHCLWRRNVLAPLSVGLWLGNTILHLKMPMVSWLYKSRSYTLQYHSHAL